MWVISHQITILVGLRRVWQILHPGAPLFSAEQVPSCLPDFTSSILRKDNESNTRSCLSLSVRSPSTPDTSALSLGDRSVSRSRFVHLTIPRMDGWNFSILRRRHPRSAPTVFDRTKKAGNRASGPMPINDPTKQTQPSQKPGGGMILQTWRGVIRDP